MNYKRCVYFVEGPCEKQLIDALKAEPRLLTPGKVHVHNVNKTYHIYSDKLTLCVVDLTHIELAAGEDKQYRME